MSPSRQRCVGALIGTFTGDALGMPVEGVSAEHIDRTHGRVDRMMEARLGRGTYTDDTQLMIATARSLLRSEGVDEEDMARSFLEHHDARRGYGRGTRRVLDLWEQGVSVREASGRVFDGGSFGNGGAMRIAPVAVLYHDRPRALRKATRRACRITHAHPLGIGGALLQAGAVARALRQPASTPPDPLEWTRWVQKQLPGDLNPEGFWDRRFGVLQEMLTRPRPASPSRVADRLGCDSTTGGSVLTAHYAAFSHLDSFREALEFAVAIGGDTDTIGAMTGAVMGAYHGVDGVPEEWYEALENDRDGRDEVVELGRRLHGLGRRLNADG